MGFGPLLNVVGAACQWVVVELRIPDLHHVQDNLGIFGIVLVPVVVKGFTCTGQ